MITNAIVRRSQVPKEEERPYKWYCPVPGCQHTEKGYTERGVLDAGASHISTEHPETSFEAYDSVPWHRDDYEFLKDIGIEA